MAETYLIGIAGPSGAGKTYLAQHLASALNGIVLSTDGYYRDLAHLSPEERAACNFDHPAALQHELLIEHLGRLSQGTAIEVPRYDFTTHTRCAGTLKFGPADIVLVEGLFALYWPELRRLLRTKIYVEMDHSACLERRTVRDVHERGRTLESVEHQFGNTVAPMADLYVRPTRADADVVVRGEAPISETVTCVLSHMRQYLAARRVG